AGRGARRRGTRRVDGALARARALSPAGVRSGPRRLPPARLAARVARPSDPRRLLGCADRAPSGSAAAPAAPRDLEPPRAPRPARPPPPPRPPRESPRRPPPPPPDPRRPPNEP